MRAKHGVRDPMRNHIGDTTTCPACLSVFGTRVALLIHLQANRTPACRQVAMRSEPLPPEVVAELDLRDTELRRTGRKLGLTSAPVRIPAVNAKGIQTGRIAI